jgi:hypothetical protein
MGRQLQLATDWRFRTLGRHALRASGHPNALAKGCVLQFVGFGTAAGRDRGIGRKCCRALD